ncbi:MAG: FAD-binding oxidoreductase [Gemmatimonadota bacterium]|nr:MAG: FAD-binding oxidoreductase [Gemmatimonadota bacterium]
MSEGADPHVVVVGGGVIGVSCAYFLARRGARVTLLERSEIGSGASFGNAGCIAPGHGPLNKPGRVKQALTSVLSETSPLYVAPRWDPELLRWLRVFSRFCTAAHQERSLRALAPLSRETIGLYRELVRGEAIDCSYRPEGYYEVFLTERALAGATREAGLIRQHGFGADALSGGAMREREPALKERIVGGVFLRDGASIDPHRFVTGLAERAGRYGAAVRTGVTVSAVTTRGREVTGVETAAGETLPADVVVLATGAYSIELARRLGCRYPLQAAKGYHRDRRVRVGETPPLRVTCMLGERSVFCTPMNDSVRFAGTLEFSGVNHVMRRSRLEQLTRSAQQYLTGLGEARAQSEWCGLRPCIADGLPVVGPVPGYRGAYVATGHAMLGLTLGPVTGKLVSEYVLDGAPSLDVGAFRLDRFGP